MNRVPYHFLKEEVRNGFYIPAPIKQAWAAELEVLLEIDRICEKYNIQYFADWGSLLGAVRHGGFIPWDDDLDIVMKREDYMRFLQVSNELEEGFHVQTYENQPDFWLFMGKVVGKNNICFESEHLRRFHNFPFIACVDIFVLDYVYTDEAKEKKRRDDCMLALSVADCIINGEFTTSEMENNLQKLEKSLQIRIERDSNPVSMGRILYKVIENEFMKSMEEDSEYLCQLFPWGLKGNAPLYPKKYYENAIRLPFEFTDMPVPSAYDRMLSERYGNYLSVNKNAGAHDYPYFEGQRKEFEKTAGFGMPEFKFEKPDLKIRNEIRSEYRNESLKVIVRDCLGELEKQIERFWSCVEKIELTTLVSEISETQTLAIEMGNLIESIKGENHPLIQDIEVLCERLYDIYVLATAENVIFSELIRTVNICKNDFARFLQVADEKLLARNQILFLPIFSSDWGSMDRAFKEALRNPANDVYVMPLPYFYKDYDGRPKEILCDANKFPGEVMAIDYRTITEEKLKLLRPEYIYIDNQYDQWNVSYSTFETYFSSNLWKYTDNLVYLSPVFCEDFDDKEQRSVKNMCYYCEKPGIINADRVLVNGFQVANMWKKHLKLILEERNFSDEMTALFLNKIESFEEAINQGNEVISQTDDKDLKSIGKKYLLYCISIGRWMEYDEAKVTEKIEEVVHIFNIASDMVEADICLYPFNESDNCGKLLNIIEQIIENSPSITLLTDKDGISDNRLMEYDAYYGDASPYVLRFTEAKKPVMIQNYELG